MPRIKRKRNNKSAADISASPAPFVPARRRKKQAGRISVFFNSFLLSSLLLIAHFSAFLTSLNYSVMSKGVFREEFLYVSLGFVGFFFSFYILFLWSKIIMRFLTAIVVAFVFYSIVHNYSVYDFGEFLAIYLIDYVKDELTISFLTAHGTTILSVVVGYLFLKLSSKYTVPTYLFFSFVCILSVAAMVNYSNSIPDDNYMVTKNQTNIKEHNRIVENNKDNIIDKNVVLLFLGEHTSLANLIYQDEELFFRKNLGKDVAPKVSKEYDYQIGFYKKYDFDYYPHAYTPEPRKENSIGRVLNLDGSVKRQQVGSQLRDYVETPVMTSYFYAGLNAQKRFGIKKSKLLTLFKKQNYNIEVIQSDGIDFCSDDGMKKISVCKTYFTSLGGLKNTNLSTSEKAITLAQIWFYRLPFFGNKVERIIFEVKEKTGVDLSLLPVFGKRIENFTPSSQFEIIRDLKEKISKAKGKNLFLTYLKLPEHPYIYDKYCHIKSPVTSWYNRKYSQDEFVDLPLREEIDNAYSEQVKCLYGKLGSFMEGLKKLDKLENTVIIVVGDGGHRINVGNQPSDINFPYRENLDKSRNNLSTIVAIRDVSKGGFNFNKSSCDTQSIVKKFIFGKSYKCIPPSSYELNEDSKLDINAWYSTKLQDIDFQEAQAEYESFYSQWEKQSQKSIARKSKILTDKVTGTIKSLVEAKVENKKTSKPKKTINVKEKNKEIKKQRDKNNEAQVQKEEQTQENVEQDKTEDKNSAINNIIKRKTRSRRIRSRRNRIKDYIKNKKLKEEEEEAEEVEAEADEESEVEEADEESEVEEVDEESEVEETETQEQTKPETSKAQNQQKEETSKTSIEKQQPQEEAKKEPEKIEGTGFDLQIDNLIIDE